MRVYRGGKKIKVKTLTLKPVPGGTAGVATLKVERQAGRHRALKALAPGDAARSRTARREAAARRGRARVRRVAGSRGPAVRAAAGQARRAALRRAAHRASTTRAPAAR